MSTCTICQRDHSVKVYSGGRCQRCYRRALRISRGLPVLTDPVSRIRSRVTVDANGCHIYEGARVNGYGSISLGRRSAGYTHRVMYEAVKGPIPAGLHIDHLCRNRACCNPEHLEAVTQGENNIRAALANKGGARGVYRTNQSSKNPWRAEIQARGKRIHLGLFPTREAAMERRRVAELEHFGRTADPERQQAILAEVAALKGES